ncbi:hypothetical protein B0T18DRAFT_414773 [Schizothecium vesticola]|uniref:Uncharacterized protein n=1 Tax=Schizothecium vesticola TaxID=314040 RepID=A0AA40EPT2_9PEZI|nr:hypothetical protein B0T18DRAFT_414773 [Schizothecium vesticola]
MSPWICQRWRPSGMPMASHPSTRNQRKGCATHCCRRGTRMRTEQFPVLRLLNKVSRPLARTASRWSRPRPGFV